MYNYNTVIFSVLILGLFLVNLWKVRDGVVSDRKETHVWPVILLAVMILVFMSSDSFLHDWDERYHALVGKNLINDWRTPQLIADPLVPTSPHSWPVGGVWLHKQPFGLWCIAGSLSLFGNSLYAVRLPSVLFTLLAIFCTFRIGRLLFNDRIAFLAAFFHATNGVVSEIASGRISTDHVDAVFTSLVELSILLALLYWRNNRFRYLLLVGFISGLAVLTKWLTGLLVFPLLLFLLFRRRDHLLKIALRVGTALCVALAVFLPWQLYIFSHFPVIATIEYNYNRLHFTKPLEGHSGGVLYYLNSLRMVFGETIIILFCVPFWEKKFFRGTEIVFLYLWLLIPLLIFTVAATKMKGYLLISYPALFLLLAFAVYRLHSFYQATSGWRKKMVLAGVVLLVLLPVRYGVERIKLFEDRTKGEKWQLAIESFCEQAMYSSEKFVVFSDHKYVQLMFACDNISAYPFELKPEYLESERLKGYRVFEKRMIGAEIQYVEVIR